MPKFRPNKNFKLNYAMQLTTEAMGNPDYAQEFKSFGEGVMADISESVLDFENTIIDQRTDTYKKAIAEDPMYGGINEVSSFTKGTDKKYPYLYSRHDPNASADLNALMVGDNADRYSATRARTDNDYLERDPKSGEVITYQSGTNQNTQTQQNYMKALYEADRALFSGGPPPLSRKDNKKMMQGLEADAKMSANTYSNLANLMRGGNIKGAGGAITTATDFYNDPDYKYKGPNYSHGGYGKEKNLKSISLAGPAFSAERLFGPMNKPFASNYKMHKIDSWTRQTNRYNEPFEGRSIHQFMTGKDGTSQYHDQHRHFKPVNKVLFNHRKMLGYMTDLHNEAKSMQDLDNASEKAKIGINRAMEKSNQFFENFRNRDTKSGLTNKTSLANRLKSNFNFDTKSGK